MESEAAIAAPIASPIWSLKYGKCHFSGDSTTPSSDTSSDAITFLIQASSDSMFRPIFGRLSIPVTHSFASANFRKPVFRALGGIGTRKKAGALQPDRGSPRGLGVRPS